MFVRFAGGDTPPLQRNGERTLYSFYRNLVGRWLAAAVTNSENPIKRREINPRPTTKGVLRMTEWCVNIDCSRVVCAVTIPPSRLRRATSLYTKEANWLVRTLFKMSF